MAYYIYKHLDKDGDTIYVGKTVRMNNRQREHLKDSLWKDSISELIYTEVENKTIMDLYEIYLINTLNPKYNTKDKRNDDLNYISFKDYEFVKYNVDLDEMRYIKRFKKKPNGLSYDYYGKYICLLEFCDKDRNIKYDKEFLREYFQLQSTRAVDMFIRALIDCKLISKVKGIIHITL